MTIEEAIKRLVIIATNLCGQSAQNPNLWPDYKAIDMAISAIWQQEHFRDVTKKVEPLTPDDLLEMDGEPVYIVDGDVTWWDIVSFSLQGWLYLVKGKQLRYSRYGEWLAYRQKPEEETV